MNNKIAIFTWYNDDRNCGQTLQAYALQSAISIINSTYSPIVITYLNDVKKRIYKNQYIYYLRRYIKLGPWKGLKQIKFNNFIKENLKVSDPFFYIEDIKKYLERNNIHNLLVGSDQVWNPQKELDPVYFLDFGNGFHKNAYGPSLCDKFYMEKYGYRLKSMQNLLNDFDIIAVRENSGKEILTQYIDKEIQVVLDPVFLLPKSFWCNLAENSTIKLNQKYILIYCLGDTKQCENLVNNLFPQMESNLKIIYIAHEEKHDYPHQWIKINYVGPYEFLYLIKNAEYVICDSFHATAFSIIFQIDFLTVPSIRKNFQTSMSRVTDLLKQFNLQSRYIEGNFSAYERINYQGIINQMYDKREKSLATLCKILESY